MAWSSDYQTPNSSGCGVVFHLQPDNTHYAVFVLSHGYVSFGINTGQFSGQPLEYWGKTQNKGEADFAMTSIGPQFNVFVNGKHIQSYTGFQGKMTSGDLGFSVLSGTNVGYGTECNITHAELWTFK